MKFRHTTSSDHGDFGTIVVIQYVHVCVAETLHNPFKLISVLFYNIVVDTVVYATARL